MRLIRNVLLTLAALGGMAYLALQSEPVQAQAQGKVCKLEIAGNDLMQFDKKELKVAADCSEVELTLTHTGKLPKQTMGHNWVLVRTPDLNAVAQAGIKAGLNNDHVPPGDKRVLAHTKVVGGGEKTSVRFPLSSLEKGGSYSFVCTVPGHFALMQGKFVIG